MQFLRRLRPFRALRIAVPVAVLVAVASPSAAIINGTIETGFAAAGFVTDGMSYASSAVLIAPSWVLTSAYFATACPSGAFLVGLDYTVPDATYGFSTVFPHPSFDPNTAANNIALIRLDSPVLGVDPLPYATATSLPGFGASVTYIGYGVTSTWDFSNTLRRSCVNTVQATGSTYFTTYYDGDGPYLGDSGGPALVDYAGQWQVAGIISHGDESGTDATHATKVAAYASFIAATIAANPPAPVAESAPRALLAAAAPNPFNPSTTIAFELAAGETVTLRVYDLAGRLVRTLIDGEAMGAGSHAAVWHGRDDSGRACPSGTYLYRLDAGAFSGTRRVVLVK